MKKLHLILMLNVLFFSLLNLLDMSGAHHGKRVIYINIWDLIIFLFVQDKYLPRLINFAHRQESETMLSLKGQQVMSH